MTAPLPPLPADVLAEHARLKARMLRRGGAREVPWPWRLSGDPAGTSVLFAIEYVRERTTGHALLDDLCREGYTCTFQHPLAHARHAPGVAVRQVHATGLTEPGSGWKVYLPWLWSRAVKYLRKRGETVTARLFDRLRRAPELLTRVEAVYTVGGWPAVAALDAETLAAFTGSTQRGRPALVVPGDHQDDLWGW